MKKRITVLLMIITISLLLFSCLRDADNVPSVSEESFSESELRTEESVSNTEKDTSPVIRESETLQETEISETDETASEMPVIYTASPDADGLYTPRTFMYHLIRDDVYGPYDTLFVRVSEFDEHLKAIKEMGYQFIFAEEYGKCDSPSVIITLDDGYDDNYTNMFPLLKKYNAKATIFVAVSLLDTEGYLTTAQVKEMSDSGYVSIQSHTVSHTDLSYQDETGLEYEFASSVEALEKITGRSVRSIAYPAGSYNDLTESVAERYFVSAYTTESPYSTLSYTNMNIPRYRVNRGVSGESFKSFLY